MPSTLRSRLVALTCAAAVAVSVVSGSASTSAGAATASSAVPSLTALRATHPGLDRLVAAGAPSGRGIATFDTVPTAGQVAALRALGLAVQPLKSLPMALVKGSVAQLAQAVSRGVARDVYPDERLRYTDTASSDETSSSPRAARKLRARGFNGKGVTVGIVDSGCDATHPDLRKRVKYNVTILSPEYANGGTYPIVALPGTNTDIGSGHGTHVAGIIAADGTSGRGHLGVAPRAKLACFAIGAVITTSAVVSAYDYMLSKPRMLGIDVINNSWGNSFRQFDPKDPVNVATKAAARRGAVSVFAAGNSGSGNGEASVSPFNQAPWVISVAAGDLDRKRGTFSSNGLRFDNGKAVRIGRGGHTRLFGDRIGNTQPDVMAPGVNISSSCARTGSVIGPCPNHGNATASGTSMASPHVAGAAAVLLSARSSLTWRQVQTALKATASTVMSRSGKYRLRSWKVGYGHVNLDKAVRLVRGPGWRSHLRRAMRQANRRLNDQDPWRVRRADLWQKPAPPVAAGGSYSAVHRVRVRRGTDALKIALVYPTPGTAANAARVTATVKNAAGKVIAKTRTRLQYTTGIATALVTGIRPGRYTVNVSGRYAASDPDTVDSDSVNGRVIFLQAAQLIRRR